MKLQKLGFIGLGNVGGKLKGSLIRNGCEVVLRDLNLDAAARWVDSPKEMAQACDIIVTCLPSPAVSATVMEAEDGVLAGLKNGKIWAELVPLMQWRGRALVP